MRTLLLLALLATFTFTSCKKKTATADTASTEQAAPAAPAMKYTLTPFAASTAYPDATLESMSYKNGQFKFKLSNYQLGTQTPDASAKMCANSAEGQHIHLIVDSYPYAAKYTADFPYDVADGDHYLLAFLSRSYHESIKNGKAFIAQKVSVANKGITKAESITQPMLFYSRPKGDYVGADTKKIMLDFFLVNATLGTDYKVKAMINDEEHMIDTWQPYYIEGLPMGKNLITLTLVDKEGNKVDTPLNPVSREINLLPDPAPAQ
ncbi:MAG: hypothetical protein H6555_01575 [Lewinellaceae bacterium]|nr:hypothetical protein [Lewinellaceae bacterium]